LQHSSRAESGREVSGSFSEEKSWPRANQKDFFTLGLGRLTILDFCNGAGDFVLHLLDQPARLPASQRVAVSTEMLAGFRVVLKVSKDHPVWSTK
jgi:hypothetical protein